MNGYLPATGDTVTIGGCEGVYTVLKMQDYYHHNPLNSEVMVLRPDGERIGWDILSNLTLVQQGINAARAVEVLMGQERRELFRNMEM